MRVLAARRPHPEEIAIQASAKSLSDLYDLLVAHEGRLGSADGDPAPYDVCLRQVAVEVAGDGPVRIAVDWDASQVLIRGGSSAVDLLAANIAAISAGAAVGTHYHFEAFPGHEYLAIGSVPLVVELWP